MEQKLLDAGGENSQVAGVDEVGRGALAGPVVAAAVVLLPSIKKEPWVKDINDSKRVTRLARARLSGLITAHSKIGVGVVSPHVVDAINIRWATRLAMIEACKQLMLLIDVHAAIIDGTETLGFLGNEVSLVGGDSKSISVAAASIVAKVERDRLLGELDQSFPGYGFTANAGYGTREHLHSLSIKGPTSIHRFSFRPVREALNLRRS